MSSDESRTARQTTMLHLLGWSLFVASAVLFIASGIRARDWLVVAASVVFLLACFAFLVPLIGELADEPRSRPPSAR